ncbi:MAG: XrtA system polysaccharide chain length determinant [Alphaproteobacteria bacterium]
MNDVYVQFLLLVRSLWLRRWYAIGVAWAVALAGWLYVESIPNRYESSAQIYVDTDTMLKDLLRGVTVEVDLGKRVQVMQQTLLSRPNLERVLRMADLDHNSGSEGQVSSQVSRIRDNVTLVPVAPNLFRLSYDDGSPEDAQRVVQSLLTIFVESNLGRSRQDISQARRFLDEQIRDYEQQLGDAEQRRAQFQRENIGLLPGDSNYFGRMQREKDALLTLQREYRDSELRLGELQRQLLGAPKYVAFRSADVGGQYSHLDTIGDLRRELAELDAAGYTDAHPDVVAKQASLEKAMAAYDEQKSTQSEIAAAGGDESPLDPNATMLNPVWEQIQVRMVESETKLASLRARISEQETVIAQLETLAKTVPTVEAEMVRLDRDYNILKAKYEDLLTRRESARIAQDLEGQTDKVQFRVIEPPGLPTAPSSPNRPALLSAVLLVALGAGLGVAFLLSQIDHTFSTANRLRASFDLTVLGTISAVPFDSYNRRRRVEIASFSVVLVGLVVAYAFALTYQGGSLPSMGGA